MIVVEQRLHEQGSRAIAFWWFRALGWGSVSVLSVKVCVPIYGIAEQTDLANTDISISFTSTLVPKIREKFYRAREAQLIRT